MPIPGGTQGGWQGDPRGTQKGLKGTPKDPKGPKGNQGTLGTQKDPKRPKGNQGDPRDPRGPRGPKGAFGALGGDGPMGPFGVVPKPFRMENHFEQIHAEGRRRFRGYGAFQTSSDNAKSFKRLCMGQQAQ